jgi:hypothetical protein
MQSGETVTVEVATHHAAHDYAKMIKGDPALEAIYDWQMGQSLLEKAVPKTPGSGVHIITGPIEVEGAEVGDVLQVDILAIDPRINPESGKCFGSNSQKFAGYQFRVGHEDGTEYTREGGHEYITVMEFIETPSGQMAWAKPISMYMFPTVMALSSLLPCPRTLAFPTPSMSNHLALSPSSFSWLVHERATAHRQRGAEQLSLARHGAWLHSSLLPLPLSPLTWCRPSASAHPASLPPLIDHPAHLGATLCGRFWLRCLQTCLPRRTALRRRLRILPRPLVPRPDPAPLPAESPLSLPTCFPFPPPRPRLARSPSPR